VELERELDVAGSGDRGNLAEGPADHAKRHLSATTPQAPALIGLNGVRTQ